MMTVLLQFGDGTHHEIKVDAEDPDEAIDEARAYIESNSWYEVVDEESGAVEERPFRSMSRR